MRKPRKITQLQLIKAIQRDANKGFCLACGHGRTHVEPDAENYPCRNCKENQVFGAEQLLIMGVGE